jgi:hypothetical protein
MKCSMTLLDGTAFFKNKTTIVFIDDCVLLSYYIITKDRIHDKIWRRCKN